LVTSFFVSSVLQNLAILTIGARPKQFTVFAGLLGGIDIGGVHVLKIDLVAVLVAGLALASVGALLSRTLIGLQIRAASENFRMALLLGVRANRVISVAFLISGLLAGTDALFLIGRTGASYPTVGLQPALFGFVSTVMGGMGSLRGAVAAAFLLAGLTVGLQVALPAGIVAYRDALVFAGVIGILLLRPQGLWPTVFVGERV
jgi:branched-chain amino acid transport system permease protein